MDAGKSVELHDVASQQVHSRDEHGHRNRHSVASSMSSSMSSSLLSPDQPISTTETTKPTDHDYCHPLVRLSHHHDDPYIITIKEPSSDLEILCKTNIRIRYLSYLGGFSCPELTTHMTWYQVRFRSAKLK